MDNPSHVDLALPLIFDAYLALGLSTEAGVFVRAI